MAEDAKDKFTDPVLQAAYQALLDARVEITVGREILYVIPDPDKICGQPVKESKRFSGFLLRISDTDFFLMFEDSIGKQKFFVERGGRLETDKTLELVKGRLIEKGLVGIPGSVNKEVREERPKQARDKVEFIGESEVAREIKEFADKAGDSEETVLLLGETGVGKEVLANLIHQNSARGDGPFEKINCGAIPGELLESELFGHEKGSFTGAIRTHIGIFERVSDGTVFLDEIGELPLGLQAKLLRVLDNDREFYRVGGNKPLRTGARIITATNQNLAELVAQKRFRQDLFYRLYVLEFEIPPLRVRRDDILLMLRYLLELHSKRMRILIPDFDQDALDRLISYEWPGNVRQLENFVKRVLALRIHPVEVKDLGLLMGYSPKDVSVAVASIDGIMSRTTPEVLGEGLSLKQISKRAVQEAERVVILRTLEELKWNRVKTARQLKISYRALLYKIKDLGIRPSD